MCSTSQRHWNQIFDLSYEELHDFESKRRPEEDEKIYIQALRAYHQRDQDQLEKIIAFVKEKSTPHFSDLLQAIELRFALVTNRAPRTLVVPHPDWEGEIFFLLARWHDLQGEGEAAVDHYQKALLAFQANGSPKKAIKSAFNAVVIELSLQSTSQGAILEFFQMSRIAKSASEFGVMIQSSQNLAWELEQVGARKLGIQILQSSLAEISDYLASYDRISTHALLYDLLLQEGRSAEAEYERELVLASAFLEMHQAVEVSLQAWVNGNLPKQDLLSTLNSSWQARWELRLKNNRMSILELAEIEQHTLQILLLGPRTRNELIEAIFQSGLPAEVELSRFKRHLSRLRAKVPGLIEFKKNHYSISAHPKLSTRLGELLG
jgi:hypothetical protein